MPKAQRVLIALSVTLLLTVALAAVLAGVSAPAVAQGVTTYNTLRVYGRGNQGPGLVGPSDPYGVVTSTVVDPVTGLPPEDAPYTDPTHIFNPQLMQAPEKDSVTWNPLFMSEFETFDENQPLYTYLRAGSQDATEKVWFREWYEPWHWDKDLNHSGALDIEPTAQMPYTDNVHDEWYPAIMQEFTYLLMEPRRLADIPEPLAGQVGETSFVFPVGMRKSDLFVNGVVPNVDTTSSNALYGYGLTSLDADFDPTTPDIVFVESEVTLFDKTRIAADFNGSGTIENLDGDTAQLSGNELAVLRLDGKSLGVNKAVQFLDHMIVVKEVSNNSAQIEVWYTGDKWPQRLDQITLGIGDMLLSGRMAPSELIRAVANGGPGTNMCDYPTGPWFAYLESIDQGENKARIWVGRAVGRTYSGMEGQLGGPDTLPADPWFLKRFYVDGHEYNVVAIKTENGTGTQLPSVCTINDGTNRIAPPFNAIVPDPTLFKFITIRTPVPKTGPYMDLTQTSYLIEQHSILLQAYAPQEELSVMPPYNHEHYVIMDVQSETAFDCDLDDVDFVGALVGPVPPILQKSGPFPYVGVGSRSPYSNRREMTTFYVDEAKNGQFLGQLKEKYGEVLTSTLTEFWYAEQFNTLPWEYTEFVFPDIGTAFTGDENDLYLLTSAFIAPESQHLLWEQGIVATDTLSYGLVYSDSIMCFVTDTAVNTMPPTWQPRVKFWYDQAIGGKKYKDANGLRIYGLQNEGAGDDDEVDPINSTYPVEVPPYTDPWDPFNPQAEEAPRKDSLTFNPSYMNKYRNSGESLVNLYSQISIREHDANEKVFMRMWYEPEYWDKVLRGTVEDVQGTIVISPTESYTFPALMQEFTYMYLDTADQPAHGQPGSSSFAFPVATGVNELPMPVNGQLPASPNSFGYGLTTFDPDFDGQPDAVRIYSEFSLRATTNITADFDGNSSVDLLAAGPSSSMDGSEMVIFTTPEKTLREGKSLQFLDYMVTLDNVSGFDTADLKFWYTGGGIHPVGSQYSLHPDVVGTRSVTRGSMAILGRTRTSIRVLGATQNNFGAVDGPWFVYVKDVNNTAGSESVTFIVGRALGHTFTAMDNGNGSHDLTPGDPWYLKRFFVDGHEYNVVALRIEPAPAPLNPGDERLEFKYITIRTPVPKVNFVNREDSQKLEGYFLGTVLGVDTSVVSVMPPFNYDHTIMEDVVAMEEKAVPSGESSAEFVFANEEFYDSDCRGEIKSRPKYEIRIVDEDIEPQFFGELKELYVERQTPTPPEAWRTEQFHTLPDQYTELRLPTGQKYLLTSNWLSEQSRVHFFACGDGITTQTQLNGFNDAVVPPINTTLDATDQSFYRALLWPDDVLRVKFLYDPSDPKDIYVNTFQAGVGTGTITGTIEVQGRCGNQAGVLVRAGAASTTTDSAGRFALANVPAGTYTVSVALAGYLTTERGGVLVTNATTTALPKVTLLGGDANADCTINLFDLIVVSSNYGSSPPTNPHADINGNGRVDLFDLVMVARNLDKVCPSPWAWLGSCSSARAEALAILRVVPSHEQVQVGDTFTMAVDVQDVTNLSGADVRLSFDAAALEVVDADGNPANGVQVSSGTFLSTTPADIAIGANTVDNVAGTVLYAASLKAGAAPASGSGTLVLVTFRAKAEGYSQVQILAESALSDDSIRDIAKIRLDGSVRIGPEDIIYMPWIAKKAQLR